MATDVSIQLGYKDSAWFAANPTFLLGKGQIIHLEQTSTYKLGDGVTALSALSFLGGSGVQSVTGPQVDNTDPLNPIVEPLGLIQIIDKEGYFFTDLTTATAYIEQFITPSVITDKSFNEGIFFFTVPYNTPINGYFLIDNGTPAVTYASLIDRFGLLDLTNAQEFGYMNAGHHILGNCLFQNSAFNLFSGTIEMNSLYISTSGGNFAESSTGKFIIKENIGINETAQFGVNFFLNSTATIFANASKYTSNVGGIHGDLQTAITNGCNVFFDGIDKENAINKVISFSAPNHSTFPTTQATIDLVDNRVQSNIKIIGDWDATSGSMPLDDESNTTPFISMWGSTIKQGWAFRVGYGQAGTVGGYDYEEGDVVYALLDNAGATPADWGDLDHNLQQATETLRGTGKVITAAIIADETNTDDQRFVTGIKLWQNFWTRVLAITHTFAAKITFSTAPRFSSVTASEYLKVDGNKDLSSVSAIPAPDVTEDTTHRFITDVERLKWNKFSYADFSSGTSSSSNSNTLSKSVLIPANTLTNGVLNIKGRAFKNGSSSYGWLNIYINSVNNLSGATLLGRINTAGFNSVLILSIDRTIPIQVGSFVTFIINTNTGFEEVANSTQVSNATIDWTVDQYVILSCQCNVGTDTMRANFLSVNQF